MQIINSLKPARTIPIVLADGTSDTVNLQGRGRITLPEGAKLDPRQEKSLLETLTVVGKASVPSSAPGSNAEFSVSNSSPLRELRPAKAAESATEGSNTSSEG